MRKLVICAAALLSCAAYAHAVPSGTYYPTEEFEDYGTLELIEVEDSEGEMMPKLVIDSDIGIPENPYWTDREPDEDEGNWSGQFDLQDASTLPDHYFINHLNEDVAFQGYQLTSGWGGLHNYGGPHSGLWDGSDSYWDIDRNTWFLRLTAFTGEYVYYPMPPYWFEQAVIIWEGYLGEEEKELVFLQQPEDPAKEKEFSPTLHTALVDGDGNVITDADSKVYLKLYEYEEQGTPAYLSPEDDRARYMVGGEVIWTGLGIVASENYYHIRASTLYEGEEYITWSDVFWCDNFPDEMDVHLLSEDIGLISQLESIGDLLDLVDVNIVDEHGNYVPVDEFVETIMEQFHFVDDQGLEYDFGDVFMGAFFKYDEYGTRPYLGDIDDTLMSIYGGIVHLAHPDYTDIYGDTIFMEIKELLEVELDNPGIISAITSLEAELDNTGIIAAITSLETEIDNSGIIQAIEGQEVDLDDSGIIAAIEALEVEMDDTGIIAAIEALEDFDDSAIVAAIEALDMDFDDSGIIAAIEAKADFDDSGIIAAIQAQEDFDDSAILEALAELETHLDSIDEHVDKIEQLMSVEVDGIPVPGFQRLSEQLEEVRDALWVEVDAGDGVVEEKPGMQAIVDLMTEGEEIDIPEDPDDMEEAIDGDLADIDDDLDEIAAGLPESYPDDGGELDEEEEGIYDDAVSGIDDTSDGSAELETAHDSARGGLLSWITDEREHWLGLVSIPNVGTISSVNLSVPAGMSNNLFGEGQSADIDVDLSQWVVGFVRQLQLYVLLFVSAFAFYKITLWGFS